MRMTTTILKGVRNACCKLLGRRKVEIGERHWPNQAEGQDGFNFLLWGDDNDLSDTVPVSELRGREIADHHGWVALDCYCYNIAFFGREPDDALDRNVYILLNPQGRVVYASEDDLGHVAAIDRILKDAGLAGYTGET